MANLLDKASIILTPTASDNGKVLCVKPSTSPYGDFDFFRNTAATRVNAQGLIENEANNLPRINYSGFTYDGSGNIVANSGCGAWLFEPQSTNLIAYSEAFDNAYWTKSGSSVTSGFTSPSVDSPLGAFKLVEDTSTAVHRLAKTFTVSTATDYYSLSVRVKKGEIGALILGLRAISFANRAEATFDLTNGVISVPADDSFGNMTNASAKIDLIANGYYNISLSVQKNTDTALVAYIYLAENITDTIATAAYTGDGTSGVYIFGAQLEQLPYATSYIPTSSESVTRNQDVCNKGGDPGNFNSRGGTLFVEAAALALNLDSVVNRDITVRGGFGSQNWVKLTFNTNSKIEYEVYRNGVLIFNQEVTPPASMTSFLKIAIIYGRDNFALWINGVSVDTKTNGATPAGLEELDFSADGDITNSFYGKTKQILYFPEVLSNTELAALTSWTSFTAMANSLNYNII
tara:strand:- start:38 stop:1420 length:1383 start_codon:yes stop_codon:yes gene_type:complete